MLVDTKMDLEIRSQISGSGFAWDHRSTNVKREIHRVPKSTSASYRVSSGSLDPRTYLLVVKRSTGIIDPALISSLSRDTSKGYSVELG